jgi:hypothetical protein
VAREAGRWDLRVGTARGQPHTQAAREAVAVGTCHGEAGLYQQDLIRGHRADTSIWRVMDAGLKA